MAFVNRILGKEEIREYTVNIMGRKVTGKIDSGTIDSENDARLFCYANGTLNKKEPCDIYSFIFDYKGKVFYLDLRRRLKENDVYWYLEYPSDIKKFNSEQIQILREAMKVYALEGFVVGRAERKQKDPTYIAPNEKVTVHIEF